MKNIRHLTCAAVLAATLMSPAAAFADHEGAAPPGGAAPPAGEGAPPPTGQAPPAPVAPAPPEEEPAGPLLIGGTLAGLFLIGAGLIALERRGRTGLSSTRGPDGANPAAT